MLPHYSNISQRIWHDVLIKKTYLFNLLFLVVVVGGGRWTGVWKDWVETWPVNWELSLFLTVINKRNHAIKMIRLGGDRNRTLWKTRWQQTYQVNFHHCRSSEDAQSTTDLPCNSVCCHLEQCAHVVDPWLTTAEHVHAQWYTHSNDSFGSQPSVPWYMNTPFAFLL